MLTDFILSYILKNSKDPAGIFVVSVSCLLYFFSVTQTNTSFYFGAPSEIAFSVKLKQFYFLFMVWCSLQKPSWRRNGE